MADLKISQLTAATDLASSEFEIVQGGTNKRAANTLLYTPPTDDGAALGTTSLKWSDLFLASGGTINFNNGDVTITHAANTLTFDGATSYQFVDPLFSFLDMRATTTNVSAYDTGAGMNMTVKNAAGNYVTAAAYGGYLIDPTAGAVSGILEFYIGSGPGTVSPLAITPDALLSYTNAALGTIADPFSSLFLTSGGVINFDNGDVTITEGTNTLTFAGATSGYTFNDGGVVLGAATGGSQGAGTINATGVYINGTALSAPNVTITTYTSGSGNFTIPSTGTFALVKAWGGGGSGAKGNSSGGGGGGGYAERLYRLSDLGAAGASISYSVAAGGTAVTSNVSGNVGGNSTFSTGTNLLTAYGGGGGATASSGSPASGGGGGGAAGVGTNTGIGGAAGGGTGKTSSTSTSTGNDHWGGAGGGGSSGSAGTAGGAAYAGGGGGGGGSATLTAAGGASARGGAGGASATSGTATSGTAPGGGGGCVTASGSGTSGAGGAGRIEVWVW